MSIQLIHGDCLEKMKDIPDGSIDMVLTDPPYGTTACKWDSVIPFEPMWLQLKRITKKRGAIVLTGSQPFTSALIMSNVKMFRDSYIWRKEQPSNFGNIKFMAGNIKEDVVVFSKAIPSKMVYNPQMGKLDKPRIIKSTFPNENKDKHTRWNSKSFTRESTHRYPVNILTYKRDKRNGLHPTQKPVALMEYLIRTYTNPGETVLDFTMGSGTTGVACVNLDRNFIGIELDAEYFKIAQDRIASTPKRLI